MDIKRISIVRLTTIIAFTDDLETWRVPFGSDHTFPSCTQDQMTHFVCTGHVGEDLSKIVRGPDMYLTVIVER